MKARSVRILGLLAVALAAVPSPAWACAACFGKSDDAMARGMNLGILSLLLIVGFVLSGVAAFAIYLIRRSARYAAMGQAISPAQFSASASQPVKE